MSSRKRIVIVAKKEIIEFIRDWRTIVALVLIPLLLFPLLFIAFPIVMQNEAAEMDEKTVDVLIQSDDIETHLVDEISEPISTCIHRSDAIEFNHPLRFWKQHRTIT